MDPLASSPQPATGDMYDALVARRSQQLQKMAGQNSVQLIEGAAAAGPPMPPGSTISLYA